MSRGWCVAVWLAGFLGASVVLAQEPHTFRVSTEIATLLLGNYQLEKPTSSGALAFEVARVDGQLRLKLGTADNLMIAEGMTKESVDGKLSADVYKFTVAGRPGVSLKFPVSNGQITLAVYAEDFSKPAIVTVAKKAAR